MIITLTKLREFTRSLDGRLEDVVAYPDAWIDERIEEGLALTQDTKQVFSTTEIYNVETDFVTNGLTEVEIIPQLEVHNLYSVECDLNYFSVEQTANNHVIVSKLENAPLTDDFTITVRYYYYPLLPFTELEMTMEVYKLVKAGIAVTSYLWLKDEASKEYWNTELNKIVLSGTFDLEKDLLEIPDERLWRGTWK